MNLASLGPPKRMLKEGFETRIGSSGGKMVVFLTVLARLKNDKGDILEERNVGRNCVAVDN